MAELQRLLVDARPLDHPTARQRGIGRYTLGLLSGLHEIGAPVVAMYERDTEAVLLAEAVPGLALERWSPQAVRRHTADGTWYLATQLMLHPIPLDPVPRIITDAALPVAAVMYDVIPERYPEQYQQRPTARAQVRLRGMLSRTLDALLAISRFAADTAADELHFPRDRIRVIGAGVESQFTPPVGDPWSRLHRVLLRDERRLVVAVAGGDARKNTHRLLQAWGALPTAIRTSHRLVVLGAHEPSVLSQWHSWAAEAGIADGVCFTGAVTDDEMVAVHQAAALAVMPSTEEGFGLPVLEAAACGCPVICSGVSSLPEVLDEPEAEFDPYRSGAIAAAIERALTDEDHRDLLRAAGRRAVQRCTWSNTARSVIQALTELGPRQPRSLRMVPRRLALAGRFDQSPLGTANTLVAEALGRQPDAPQVHLLVDGTSSPEPTAAGARRFPVRALGRFLHPSMFDHVVAVLGDADDHVATAALVSRHPAHLWLRASACDPANLAPLLANARSLIVPTEGDASAIRNTLAADIPVLVLPPPSGTPQSADAVGRALLDWLDTTDRLPTSTLQHTWRDGA